MKDKIGLTVYAMIITIIALGLFMERAFITDEANTEVKSAKEGYTSDDLLDAIEFIESGGNSNAVGGNGEVGAYQIKKVYVDEVNRICKVLKLSEQFTYEDRWNRDKSRKMGLIHNQYWAGVAVSAYLDMNFGEAFIRSHKGAGGYRVESTKKYWLKVKAYMERPVK